jgi:three-Cys-motif partner protein
MPAKTPRKIQKWTCHKLESFSEFIDSYTPATRKADYGYLELFTGYGTYLCNGLDCSLEGSALRALKSKARFISYGFLTPSRTIANSVKPIISEHYSSKNALVLVGNPNNEKHLGRLMDSLPRSASSLAFIDPGGYRRLHWSTLEKLVTHGKNWQGDKIDLLIVFPIEMALLRNMQRPECEESVTRFYGNQEWEEIKRQKRANKISSHDIKQKLVELYKNGLQNLGYRYVGDFKPASPTPDPYYHLIYASDILSRSKQIKEAWGKSRFLRCELLFGIKSPKSS